MSRVKLVVDKHILVPKNKSAASQICLPSDLVNGIASVIDGAFVATAQIAYFA